MSNTDVTIVVVPRERFSYTAPSLESIYAHTPFPLQLVYVDGGSPRRVARYLRDQARAKGFTLIRTDPYLSPNEARNLALAQVKTTYVVFIDNDVLVSPGWLDALVECAEETGAWIVGPLVMVGEPGHEVIHQAGGAAYIEEVEGRRLFSEEHFLLERPLKDITTLDRGPTEFVEFHSMLMRTECFKRIGKLDEQLLTMYEHLDVCMTVRAAGGEVYLEPRAVVSYAPTQPLALSDLPYYFLRWSDDWNESTNRRFQTKWRLAEDDPSICYSRNWVTEYRQAPLWKLRPLVDRLTRGRSYGIERSFLAPLEVRICRYVARWAGRDRPRHDSVSHVREERERMDAALRAN
ncbi:MAG TPA: glycosyltransferase [Pyrinomonadaceae bacterium]|nr:glycosyltransferase [Pyrinomonadaceae bacterium]